MNNNNLSFQDIINKFNYLINFINNNNNIINNNIMNKYLNYHKLDEFYNKYMTGEYNIHNPIQLHNHHKTKTY